jgi:hypothetical protein
MGAQAPKKGLDMIQHAKKTLANIRALRRDPESAHGLESQLYQDVLQAIADGKCPDPAALARVALQANKIKYPRWFA